MVQASDFTTTCNTTVTDWSFCTPETCCLAQGQINYLPSLGGNALFAAIFGILIIPNVFFGIRYKTWSFFAWITLGLIGELVGYIGRIQLNNNIFSFDAFLTYLIPLTIAPAFITASIYLCLARLIHILDPGLKASRLKPMTYTKIFVTFDFIALVLQGAGGGLAATADTKAGTDQGVNVMIGGLAFQVFSLVTFIILCSDFTWRLYKNKVSGTMAFDVSAAEAPATGIVKRPSWMNRSVELGGPNTLDYETIKRSKMFKGFIVALATATILILIRSAYRCAELKDGFNGHLANDEVAFMILEGPMIILSCIALTAFHPGLAMKGMWSMKTFRLQAESAKSKIMMEHTSQSAGGSYEQLTAPGRDSQ